LRLVQLVWTIPVVAAAIAAGLVAARARAIEDAAGGLLRAVARLREIEPRLRALRAAARQTDARIAAFRARHAPPHQDGPGDPERRSSPAG
jgi:uncharacterized protein involved in exopolysaccharide biosynthesis